MKRFLYFLLCLTLLAGCGKHHTPEPGPDPIIDPVEYDGGSGITYQLLVYSFCDSDGDGIGDFNGITSKLDYLREMGVRAIWLSPIHKATSYHGYDVEDYDSVNPEYGTEADFRRLLQTARSKGIKIYIDYVLNHTSKEHPWFLDAKSSEDSQYRDRYIFSKDPSADAKAGKVPMMETGGYNAGEWTSCSTSGSGPQRIKFSVELDASGKPKSLTAEKAETIHNNGARNSGIWLYYGDGKMEQFCSDLSLTLDFQSDWGVLVRTSTSDSWPVGTKYGAKEGASKMEWGRKLAIYPSSSSFDPKDILLPGMEAWYYHSMFGSYMPDINYGPAASCETSAAFKALTASADRWIEMGVDGFRLDAVKHIYHNANSDENPAFLAKFYDHCNATYKACGGEGNIYVVGEQFSEANEVAPYYKGLPALFEFCFWWRLKDAINGGRGSDFVSTIQGYQNLYKKYRPDYIEATKLSNHDEDRAGNDLQKSVQKMKLAAAVLLTCSGEPYIYQGEELGYWGSKSGGDAYVRTPVKWTKDGGVAAAKLGGQVDNAMLTPAISVEAQSADEGSILSLYRSLGQARDKYKALAQGALGYCSEASSQPSACAYFRLTDDQSILVVHNFGGGNLSLSFTKAKLDNMILSNGSATVKDGRLTLGPWSSALFLQ